MASAIRILLSLLLIAKWLPLLCGEAAKPVHPQSLPLRYDGESWIQNRKGNGHALVIERSRTNRARCRRCGGTIDKGALRIGLPIEDIRGSGSGVITGWHHLSCCHLAEEECLSLATVAFGWGNLTENEKPTISDTLSRPATSEEDSDPDPVPQASPRRPAPPELVATLLPFQEEGLAWMCEQEKGPQSGGVLADEMGMGKTLQMISLLLAHRRAPEDYGWPSEASQGATLVVCPVSALSQWHSEMLKFSKPGSLSVLIYHGTDRHEATPAILSQFDVVVTSYSVVEAEFRKHFAVKKVPCPHCSRKLLPRTLVTHLRFFCGPDAERSASLRKREVGNSRGGLKKAMKSLGIGKKEEAEATPTPGNIFREYVRGAEAREADGEGEDAAVKEMEAFLEDSSAVAQGHDSLSMGAGDFPGIDPEDLQSMDSDWWGAAQPPRHSPELLAATAAAEAEERLSGGSSLHGIQWHRIVLDEAHKIKARSSSTAQAIFAMRARKRWCLTGTPLQNRVGDLYSLVRFLEFQPWASYFCSRQGCDCSSVEYQFGPHMRKCKGCGHSPMTHYSHFNKYVLNPIKKYGNVGEGRRAMRRLRRDVLGVIVLRRTKQERQADMLLPERTIHVEKIPMADDEKDFYESIYKMSAAQFDSYVAKGTLLHNYAHVFELLSRLRQACNHPYLVIHRKGSSEGGMEPCGVCAGKIEKNESVITLCQHTFHFSCMAAHIEGEGGGVCPRCFAPLSVDMRPGGAGFQGRGGKRLGGQGRGGILRMIDPDKFQSSSKLDRLVDGVNEMIKNGGKGIIFSQFTRMLDLVSHVLRLAGIASVKVTGDMSRASRDNSLLSFKNATGTIHVVLISLKAGGEGLNLQEANHVFVLDPWWNPASEMQAIDRTHRIGQTRDVKAVRYIMQDSIEERILKLQEKKQLIVSGTLDRQEEALAQLTAEDMRFLFQR